MKATQRDFARGLPRGAQDASIFFFCGPDEAGASAAASKVIETLPDAGFTEDEANAIIMAARAHWFDDEPEAEAAAAEDAEESAAQTD